ncbi:Glucose-6-phosphate isomerase [Xanthobacter versatilis]|uniref:Glucose-6-phosphate isomerase n=1 Tax=Xanthobacter autotrophicus (strain ATCC BAA-1158 / Py2) TaxID=78245 RepID=G6PI_XANP2|nr:RecName: Full=Glucose-6-phosphate isomerase; Short=GPI; AltName: Full=Phosphoglucose isomerase; Short=PGI; AltName: Full=Phosphohexose isomerase; Short=PHI [Xanthobacter autotrophicus Py2]ABS66499.1 Glucose-6-phosphate isomerase [Xanthobacter autotrophicus Py2]
MTSNAHATDAAFKALAIAWTTREGRILDLFAQPDRFERFSVAYGDLLIDFSKTAITDDILSQLLELARAGGVEAQRDAMFAGDHINLTEDRAVLHTALRDQASDTIQVDGIDVKPGVVETLARLGDFATGVREGRIAGARGGVITDVVNIGIGGSDLGPAMVTLALAPYHDGPRCHFVSNVDSAHITDVLKGLDPATTLFIVASKTFTTVETMTNAATARAFIVNALGEDAVGAHFAAVSTALDKVGAFGIPADRIFGFWDWVGGRYSVWSAIGLPLMLAIGPDRFREFLAGAAAMDEHFRSAVLDQNLPVLLGLIGLWHRNACGFPSRAIIPYDQRLARLPAYLQQLDMESNGKSVTRDGAAVSRPTGPIVWGEPGTNAQHAFFQLLHQGTDIVPVEFLVGAQSHEPALKDHQDLLVANCLAQSEALMRGRTLEEATAQLRAKGISEDKVAEIAPHRVFPGDRPSLTIAYATLDPFTLGRIIALYEHRVFVEAAVWGINGFDQWGVELGKELATQFLPAVTGGALPPSASASTSGLIAHLDAVAGG